MVLPFKDTSVARENGNKLYTEEQVRGFYKNMYNIRDGCYSVHLPTWEKMCKEYQLLTLNLMKERQRKLIEEKYPSRTVPERPSGTRKVKDGLHNSSFPWYELGCGFAIGSLFWGIMFALFGGN